MANYDPTTGQITSVPNTLLERLGRMMFDTSGLLKILLPLIILIGIFFVIKKYTKNKKILIGYSIVAIIVYFFLLWLFSLYYIYY